MDGFPELTVQLRLATHALLIAVAEAGDPAQYREAQLRSKQL
jgi:hypothetical protein